MARNRQIIYTTFVLVQFLTVVTSLINKRINSWSNYIYLVLSELDSSRSSVIDHATNYSVPRLGFPGLE